MYTCRKCFCLFPPEAVSGLFQEPDSYGLMWERTNNGWPALQNLYLGVLNGVWAISNSAAKTILFVVQVVLGNRLVLGMLGRA